LWKSSSATHPCHFSEVSLVVNKCAKYGTNLILSSGCVAGHSRYALSSPATLPQGQRLVKESATVS
jgi:hypothetical protein